MPLDDLLGVIKAGRQQACLLAVRIAAAALGGQEGLNAVLSGTLWQVRPRSLEERYGRRLAEHMRAQIARSRARIAAWSENRRKRKALQGEL